MTSTENRGKNASSEGNVTWRTPLASGKFPSARGGHSAVLHRHYLIIFGGHFHKGDGKFEYLNDMYVLNLETLKWRQKKAKGTIPNARYGHSATVFNGSMYIFGGRGRGGTLYRDVDRLDLSTWTWSKMSSTSMMPPGRSGHSATLIGNKIVIFGGYDGTKTLNDMWVYNIQKMTWLRPRTSGRLPHPRHGHTCVLGEEGGLIVFGGYQIHSDGKLPVYLSDVRELNLHGMEWRNLSASGAFPSGRFGHTAAIFGSQMVFFGGYSSTARRKLSSSGNAKRHPKDVTPEEDEAESDEKKDEGDEKLPYLYALDTEHLDWWQPTSNGEPPDMRYGHSMTYVGDGHFLIFGGWDGTRPLNSLVDLEIPKN